MTGQRLDEKGALISTAEALPHILEWYRRNEYGFVSGSVALQTLKFLPKWQHQYLITGSVGGMAVNANNVETARRYWLKLNSSILWRVGVGGIHAYASGISALSDVPVPILALWTSPDEVEVELQLGIDVPSVDQDWALGRATHNLHVIDLGCLA